MAQKEIAKKKKKIWFSILGTKHFNNTEIGETLVSEPSSLVGKNISLNLGNLTNDVKLQNVKITFKIKEVKDSKALTEIVKYEVVQTSLKRMVHKGKNKIDDSFKLKTKDNVNVKIKPFIITKASTKKSILTSLNKKTRELITDVISKTDYETLLEDLIRYKIQNILKKELKKIYPLAQLQIRIFEKIPS